MINGSWALSNVGLLVCKKLVPWRWLQRCTRWGKVVSISQSKVPLHNVALLIEKSEGDIIVGLSNARYPEEIVASLMSASRKCVFYGVLLQPNDTTLFMQSDQQVSENTTPHGVPDGAFVTLSVSQESIELRVASPTSYTISASHDEIVNPMLDFFLVTISDFPCDIAPCWSVL